MKKEERVFKIINNISDNMLEEAAKIDNKEQFKSLNKSKTIWKKWAGLAASLILVLGLSLLYFMSEGNGKLPILTLDTEGFFGGSYGFEGYWAYDISDLVNNNPWAEDAAIDSLPVFKNIFAYDKDGNRAESDLDRMKAIGFELAERFGMDLEEIAITDDGYDQETIEEMIEESEEEIPESHFYINNIYMEDESIEIRISRDFQVSVIFKIPIPLGDEYKYSYYSSYEEILSLAGYLRDKYSSYIDMGNPEINIYGGDYSYIDLESPDINAHGVDPNTSFQQTYNFNYYDKSGDIVEQILNYNLNNISFGNHDEGNPNYIGSVHFTHADLSGKIGDYPIITGDEAKDLLLNGNFLTSVPDEFPGEEFIKKYELVYRTSDTEMLIFPYYRFYVEMPNMFMEEDELLKTYGAFYVPAVDGEYIENMPLWQGQFN